MMELYRKGRADHLPFRKLCRTKRAIFRFGVILADNPRDQNRSAARVSQAPVELDVPAASELLIEQSDFLEDFAPVAATEDRIHFGRFVNPLTECRIAHAEAMAETVNDRAAQ